MAYYDQGVDISAGPALADLSSYQYFPVALASGGVELADSAGEMVLGILQNAPTSGQQCVVRISGTSKVKCDSTVALESKLVAQGTSGYALPVATNSQYVFGIALAAASSDGDIVECLLTHAGINQFFAAPNS